MNRAEMRARYESAPTSGEFIAGARQNQERWGSLVARATVSPTLRPVPDAAIISAGDRIGSGS